MVMSSPRVIGVLRGLAWMTGIALMIGCASPPAPKVATAERFAGTDGRSHPLAPEPPDLYSVVLFFSADCHVLRAHDERLRQLALDFQERRVRFVAVDSEVDATLERDRAEALQRQYSFPILLDPGGRLAGSLDAVYAGYIVVVDGSGIVRYRGGIDSDRVHLRDDATPHLRNALEDLVAGRTPRTAESKALGCALRLR
jgi:AhpC/TSA family